MIIQYLSFLKYYVYNICIQYILRIEVKWNLKEYKEMYKSVISLFLSSGAEEVSVESVVSKGPSKSKSRKKRSFRFVKRPPTGEGDKVYESFTYWKNKIYIKKHVSNGEF